MEVYASALHGATAHQLPNHLTGGVDVIGAKYDVYLVYRDDSCTALSVECHK